MASLNNCQFIGNAARDAVFVEKDGKSWTEFSIAINSGPRENQRVMWINCRVFGKSATNALNLIKKGNLIFVDGKIDINAYIRKDDGKAAVGINLACNEWQWLNGKELAGDTEKKSEFESFNSTVPFGADDLMELPF